MPLPTVVAVLVLVAVLLGLMNRYAPDMSMDPKMVKIINVVVIVAVVCWILSLFGLFDFLDTVRVGRR